MNISISLQLYTAFFKGKVQEQLQDMDAIFSVLRCLGYETGQDEVSLKEPDTVRAPWVSLELFLVQLDLEVIKEIMERFPENKCTLKEIVRARRRNADLDSAREYLESKLAKRQKLDVTEGNNAAKSKQIKEVHGEVHARFPDVKQTAVSGYTPSTAYKDPPLVNTSDANDVNGDDSSAGFLATDEDPSAAASTDARGDTIGKRSFPNNPADCYSDHDLYGLDHAGSQLRGGRHRGLDAHNDPSPCTRPPPYSVHIKADTSMGGSHSLPYTGTYAPAGSGHRSHIPTKAKVSVRAVSMGQGTSGYDDKYVNQRDMGSSADQPLTNESAKVTPNRFSVADSVNFTRKGRSQEEQNNFSTLSNGMEERGRATGQAGITSLNSDLKHQLTLSNTDVGSPDKASQRFSDASKERRLYDSQRPAGEKDGTRSQDKSTGHTYTSDQKSIYGAEAANYPGRSATEVKSYTVKKIETKGAQPVPSGTTVDKKSSKDLTSSHHQAAEAQYSVHSSRIGPNPEDVLNGRGSSLAAMKQQKDDHSAICDMCTADSNSICTNCFRSVCGRCVRIYNTDLCSATKGQHNFVELKKKSQAMSADLEALSNQPGANVKRETGSDDKTWNCSRCTFLNSPEHGICAMCASSRGVNLVDQIEIGSRVCRICTFHNKACAKVCDQCGKTLDLTGNPELCV